MAARSEMLTTLVLPDAEARLLADRQATVHLSSNYLRGVCEGQDIFVASKFGAGHEGKYLLKVYMLVRFVGNRFIPDSTIPSMSMYHCLDMAEYELRRLGWTTKRDGAVGWQFDVVDLVDEWVLCTDVQDRQVAAVQVVLMSSVIALVGAEVSAFAVSVF